MALGHILMFLTIFSSEFHKDYTIPLSKYIMEVFAWYLPYLKKRKAAPDI